MADAYRPVVDLDRIERTARDQANKSLGSVVALMPGEVLELARLARIGVAAEAQGWTPA